MGQGEPAKIIVNRRPYDECPVGIYLQRMDLKDLVDMYLYAKSAKRPLISETVLDESNWYHEFARYIEGQINRYQQEEMDKMSKDSKRQGSLNKSKRGSKR